MASKEDVHRELDQLTQEDRAEIRDLFTGRSIDESVGKKIDDEKWRRSQAVYGIIHNPKLSRRRFLQTVGASAVVAPFLGTAALGRGHARAQAEGEVDNLLLIDWPCGMEPGWTPMGTGKDYQLVGEGPDGQVPSMWSKEHQMKTLVDKHRDKIMILSGWATCVPSAQNILSHSLGPASMWTNYTGAAPTKGFSAIPSIEQHIGKKLMDLKHTPLQTIHAGVMTNFRETPASNISNKWYHWAAPNTGADPEDDPGKVYMTMMPFLASAAPGATAPSDGAAPNPDMMAAVKGKKKSVLDYVMSEIQTAKNKIASEDLMRLESHLQAVRDLETRLFAGGGVAVSGGDGTTAGATCNMVMAPALTGTEATRTPKNGAATAVAHAQLIAMAFKCGVTKVATLQLGESDCMYTIPYEGSTAPMHRASHNMGNSNDRQTRWVSTRWMMDRIADIIEVFAKTDVGGGKTLLDKTLIVASTEMGIQEHPVENVAMIVAGGGNGPFKFRLGEHIALPATMRHSKMNYTLEDYFDVDAKLGNPSAAGGDNMGSLVGTITV